VGPGAKYAAIAGALMLGGCSGEPGANDILLALNDNAKWRVGVTFLTGSDQAAAELLAQGTIDKSACAQAQGTPGYICDFRWGRKLQDGNVQYGQPMTGRFFKSGNRWVMEILK
jgi:hypothetical protein